jgi:hypothetical protein
MLEPNKTTAKITWASSVYVYSLYVVMALEELLQVFMKDNIPHQRPNSFFPD